MGSECTYCKAAYANDPPDLVDTWLHIRHCSAAPAEARLAVATALLDRYQKLAESLQASIV